MQKVTVYAKSIFSKAKVRASFRSHTTNTTAYLSGARGGICRNKRAMAEKFW